MKKVSWLLPVVPCIFAAGCSLTCGSPCSISGRTVHDDDKSQGASVCTSAAIAVPEPLRPAPMEHGARIVSMAQRL